MHAAMVDLSTSDGTADSYLVIPDGDGPHPAVLLFEDAFGLRPRLKEMADRIAGAGYAVLAPNLLYRGGPCPQVDLDALSDPDRRGAEIGKVMPLIGQLNQELITRDTKAYLDFLAAQDRVDPGPVVLVGYCMGGTNGLRAITAFPDRIRALASFHAGRVVTEDESSPHLKVGAITGEVYFAHADNDQSMTPDQIAALEAELDRAGVRHRSEVYPGAPHGFTMADTASYDEAAERRHWENLFALLERTRD